MSTAVTIFQNDIGQITFKMIDGDVGLLHLNVPQCEYIPKTLGLEMISALDAFYKINSHKFVQVLEVCTEYMPSADVILATLNMMRSNHQYFLAHLIHTGVVVHGHADACRQYLKNWRTSKPVHFLESAAEIHTLSS